MFTKIKEVFSKFFQKKEMIVDIDVEDNTVYYPSNQIVKSPKIKIEDISINESLVNDCECWSPGRGFESVVKKYEEEVKNKLPNQLTEAVKDKIPTNLENISKTFEKSKIVMKVEDNKEYNSLDFLVSLKQLVNDEILAILANQHLLTNSNIVINSYNNVIRTIELSIEQLSNKDQIITKSENVIKLQEPIQPGIEVLQNVTITNDGLVPVLSGEVPFKGDDPVQLGGEIDPTFIHDHGPCMEDGEDDSEPLVSNSPLITPVKEIAESQSETSLINIEPYTEEKEKIFQKLKKILFEDFGKFNITINSCFLDFVLDSLDFVEIVMAIETDFNIEIDDNEAEHTKTIDDAVRLIDKKLKEKNTSVISAATPSVVNTEIVSNDPLNIDNRIIDDDPLSIHNRLADDQDEVVVDDNDENDEIQMTAREI